MADELPAVDPAEVAALERQAAPRNELEARLMERGESHGPPVKIPSDAQDRVEAEAFRRAPPDPPPPAALQISVPMPIEIQQELAALRSDVEALMRWQRHTMALVMVLAHQARITPDEAAAAQRRIDEAEAGLTKGPS